MNLNLLMVTKMKTTLLLQIATSLFAQVPCDADSCYTIVNRKSNSAQLAFKGLKIQWITRNGKNLVRDRDYKIVEGSGDEQSIYITAKPARVNGKEIFRVFCNGGIAPTRSMRGPGSPKQ